MSPSKDSKIAKRQSARSSAVDLGEKPPKIPPFVSLHGGLPCFIRLPKPGKRCDLTGLSRSSLNDLILGPNPPVRSVVVARNGASRGIRLIPAMELINFLSDLMEQQSTGKGVSDE